MKKVLTVSLLILGVCVFLLVHANEKAAADVEPNSAVSIVVESESTQESESDEVDWKQDKVCKAVFFAVLEGLYNDGVQDDVVASIIGPKSDDRSEEAMKKRMKRSFVMDCPLCQPTFEAFLAYQHRPVFSDGSGASHFGGEGLEEAVRQQLLSDDLMTRLSGMQVPIGKWTLNKLNSLELTEEETMQWSQRISERSKEGISILSRLQQESEHYQGWSLYLGCAACKATEHAAGKWASEGK